MAQNFHNAAHYEHKLCWEALEESNAPSSQSGCLGTLHAYVGHQMQGHNQSDTLERP